MWKNIMRRLREVLRFVSEQEDVAERERVEAEQIRNVRDRLDRIREQLIIIDKTQSHRYH